jgi:hypothetical protein
MITLLVYLAIFVILAIVVWWVMTQLPLPPPLDRILQIVFVVIGAIILIYILLNFAHLGSEGLPTVK